jgi:hypothetical protein
MTHVGLSSKETLDIAENDAWNEYLERVRDFSPLQYENHEPGAWKNLQERLREIKAQRQKLARDKRPDRQRRRT